MTDATQEAIERAWAWVALTEEAMTPTPMVSDAEASEIRAAAEDMAQQAGAPVLRMSGECVARIGKDTLALLGDRERWKALAKRVAEARHGEDRGVWEEVTSGVWEQDEPRTATDKAIGRGYADAIAAKRNAPTLPPDAELRELVEMLGHDSPARREMARTRIRGLAAHLARRVLAQAEALSVARKALEGVRDAGTDGADPMPLVLKALPLLSQDEGKE